jgi:branched-chain amino acid transport system permease protein
MKCGYPKENYIADGAIFPTPTPKYLTCTFVIILFLFPLFCSQYTMYLMTTMFITLIAALGLNILTGFTGLISLGHGAFIGVGAYVSGILTIHLGASFWIALPCAGIAAALLGILFGLPSLRIEGLYLAIATLAAQFIITFAIRQFPDLTGGDTGLTGIPHPSLFGWIIDSHLKYYYLCLILSAGFLVFARNLFRTRIGRSLISVRDRDISAEVMGVNVFKTKLTSFIVSSFFAGVAGSLYGHQVTSIAPEVFGIDLSIYYLSIIIIGGMGTILGTVFGTIFMTMIPEMIRILGDSMGGLIPSISHLLPHVKLFVFGFVIVFFLVYEPEGLFRIWKNIKNYFVLWPFKY